MELLCAFCDALFQFTIETFELAILTMQFSKDAYLGAKQFWNNRNGDVVDSATLVSLDTVEICEVNGGDKDDGYLLESRVLTHHVGELKSVDLGHAYVHQYDGDIMAQKLIKRLSGRARLNEVFT